MTKFLEELKSMETGYRVALSPRLTISSDIEPLTKVRFEEAYEIVTQLTYRAKSMVLEPSAATFVEKQCRRELAKAVYREVEESLLEVLLDLLEELHPGHPAMVKLERLMRKVSYDY